MKATLYHLQINVSNAAVSFPFYKEFLGYFGYTVISEGSEYLGMSNGTTDFWIMPTEKRFLKNKYHRKNTGLNHICFRVGVKADVDTFFKEFLKKKKMLTLYNTPKPFPEYTEKYYAVFFEDPDRIKIEVAFL
jgi:catechol 2,3-dioxygenase-like lactoylglutathione lyase family enzyme